MMPKEERIAIARGVAQTVSGNPFVPGQYHTVDQLLTMPKEERIEILRKLGFWK